MKYLMIVFFAVWMNGCSEESTKKISSAAVDSIQTFAETAAPSVKSDTVAEAAENPITETVDTVMEVQLLNTRVRDKDAFTQGLVYYNGFLYESTGLRGKSSLRKVDLISGRVLKKKALPANIFAEGITVFNDKIYMLTWDSQFCAVYDIKTFEQINSFSYRGEGWGLTNDANNLYMSDGSNIIRVINPETFDLVRILTVLDENYMPIGKINELEFVNGYIYANIWMKDEIIKIDPASGKITASYDFSGLREFIEDNSEVESLNGIAYNKELDIFYLTGKNWGLIFEIKISP